MARVHLAVESRFQYIWAGIFKKIRWSPSVSSFRAAFYFECVAFILTGPSPGEVDGAGEHLPMRVYSAE